MINDYSERLATKGIAPSYQRIKILEYLDKKMNHPTAEMIYHDLKKQIPTLSKTTVYNTLKIFSSNDIIVELNIFENEVRYDIKTDNHIHFKCLKCDKIYDLESKCALYEKEMIEGHKIMEYHVNLKGICKNCLEK